MCRALMLSFAALSALALNTGLALADDNGHGHDRHRKALADKAQRTGHPYPLNVDPLDDSLADADRPVTIIHAGRELRFASEENTKTFKAAPGKYLAEVDPKIIAQQKPTHPLETCVVSGQKLGETDEPVACVYGNRLVRFCCGGCVNMFEKRPAKHLAAIDDHAESQ